MGDVQSVIRLCKYEGGAAGTGRDPAGCVVMTTLTQTLVICSSSARRGRRRALIALRPGTAAVVNRPVLATQRRSLRPSVGVW